MDIGVMFAAVSMSVALAATGAYASKKEVEVIEFYTKWCGVCTRVAGDVEKMKDDLKDVSTVKTIDAESEVGRPLAEHFEVNAYPTFIITVNGKEVDKIEGFESLASMENRVREAAK